MSTQQRKAKEKERRRNDILDAAEGVIFSRGLERATMDEIAGQADVSKGTLYLYFKNKSELLLGICERGTSKLNRQFAKVLTSDKKGIEIIREIGETYIDFVRNNPDYFRTFLYYESFESEEELADSRVAEQCENNVREAFNYTVRALQIGMQDGSIDESYDPRELALSIWGATRGIIKLGYMKMSGPTMKVLEEVDIDTDQLLNRFTDLIIRGIAKEK